MQKFSGGAVTVEVSYSCSFSPSSVKSSLTKAFCWSVRIKVEALTSHYLIPLSLLLPFNKLDVEPSRRLSSSSHAQAVDYLPTELDDAKMSFICLFLASPFGGLLGPRSCRCARRSTPVFFLHGLGQLALLFHLRRQQLAR